MPDLAEPDSLTGYAISHTSLVAADERELASGDAAIALTALATADRLKTVSPVVEALKESTVVPAIGEAAPDWVILMSDPELGRALGEVFDTCGEALLDLIPDPREPPELWLLALATMRGASVVHEPHGVVDLGPSCAALKIPLIDLSALIP